MSISTQTPTPYAPASAIVQLIRRVRDKGIQAPINADVLARAGTSDSLIPRTLQALVTLELIDDKGSPTETLQAIRVCSEKDYKACLAAWIKRVYSEVFMFVDPSTDDDTAIRDAFRTYSPHAQQSRMISLFTGLCAEAGLMDESKKPESKPRVRKLDSQRISSNPSIARRNERVSESAVKNAGGLPPAIAGLLSSLPQPERGWTKQQRDKFIVTFNAVLDFVYPVVAKVQVEEEDEL